MLLRCSSESGRGAAGRARSGVTVAEKETSQGGAGRWIGLPRRKTKHTAFETRDPRIPQRTGCRSPM